MSSDSRSPNPYRSPESDSEPQTEREVRPHSKLAVASFVLAVIGAVLSLGVVVALGSLFSGPASGPVDSTAGVIIFCCMFAIFSVTLVALVLGVLALNHTGYNLILAALGVAISLMMLFCNCGLMLL